jgi:hypothetical protein
VRLLTTGFEPFTSPTQYADATTAFPSTGYNMEISTSSPRSGNRKFRVYRNAANTAYATAVTLTTNIPALSSAFSPAVTINDSGGISSGDTTLIVNDGSGILVGEMLVIETEYIQVTAKATNTLTITRARLNSQSAAHADGLSVQRYGAQFSTPLTANEAIDASETGIDVNDATGVQVGDMISIDQELMQVTSVGTGGAGATLTVIRGRVGTTGATHNTGQVMLHSGDAFSYTSAADDPRRGDCIVIDSEELFVTHTDTTNNILRCAPLTSVTARGINGTTSATHAAAANVNIGWTAVAAPGEIGGAALEWKLYGGFSHPWETNGVLGTSGLPGGYPFDPDDPNSRLWARFFINFATLPTGLHTLEFFTAISTASTPIARIFFRNGTVSMSAGGAGTSNALFTPATGTWYRFVVAMRGDAGSTIASGQIFTVNVFNETTNECIAGKTCLSSDAGSLGTGTDISSIRLGMFAADHDSVTQILQAGTGDADWSFDDFAVNDNYSTLHNYPPNYGEVIGIAVPVSNNGPNEFELTETGVPSILNYLAVDDPTSTTTYLKTPVGAATAEDNLGCTTTSTLGVVGTVTAAMLWVYHADVAGEDGANHAYGVRDGSGNLQNGGASLQISISDTNQVRSMPIVGTGTDGLTAFTNASFDAMEFYIKHTSASANQRKKIYAMCMEVEEDGQAAIGGALTNTVADNTVVTTTVSHLLTTGDKVSITGSNSTPAIDGTFVVTVLSGTTFSIAVTTTGAGTAGTVRKIMANPMRMHGRMNQGATT